MRIVQRAKREVAERVLGQALGLLGNSPDKGAPYVIKAIEHIARSEKQGIIHDWAYNWLGEGKPGREFLGRILANVHPNVRRRYIARMVVSMLFRDPQIHEYCMRKYGITPPYTMLISPTIRCNFRC